ncbi:MAG: type II secretion system protein [Phycisphaerae bacterium]
MRNNSWFVPGDATRADSPVRGEAAFTLVELLAVVAIIALLVSIMIPSLQTAKEMARRAPCQANLKNLGTGFLGYAGANKQWFPPNNASFDPGRNVYPQPWQPTPIAYHEWTKGEWVWQWADFIAEYFDSDARTTTPVIRGTSSIGSQPPDGVYDRRVGYANGWQNGQIVVSRKVTLHPSATTDCKQRHNIF